MEDDALRAIAGHANGDARVALNVLELAAAVAGAVPVGSRAHPLPPDGHHRPRPPHPGAPATDPSTTTRTVRSTSISSPPCTSRCATAIPTPPSTGWRAWSRPGRIPLYIARRLVRFASEDIGNADPRALSLAVAAKDAVHFIGMPEGNTALAQAAIYLAVAPKSNAVYRAYGEAARDAHESRAAPVPLHLRNAPTRLDEGPRLRKGLRVRARPRGGRDIDDVSPRRSRRPTLLSARLTGVWRRRSASVSPPAGRHQPRTAADATGDDIDMPGILYYVGRFLQLLAMSLLLMAIMTAGPLGPSPRIFGAGVAVFVVGWLLVRQTGGGAQGP